jgi:Mor family transcriptional regulator
VASKSIAQRGLRAVPLDVDDEAAAQPRLAVADATGAEPDILDRMLERVLSRSEVVKAALRSNPDIAAEARHSPELVELIANYVLAEFDAQVARAIEEERRLLGGDKFYVRSQSAAAAAAAREALVRDVLALFNGRNVTEVARRLQVGRATVYRIIKQARRAPVL